VVLTRFGARSDGTFYKVSAPYSPEHDRGVSWIDKDIAIDWPVAPADAVLSAKDLALPALAGLPDCFFCEPMDSER